MAKAKKGQQVVVVTPNGTCPTSTVLTVVRDDHPTHAWLTRDGKAYVMEWAVLSKATPEHAGCLMTADEWQTLHELERYKWERRWLRIRVIAIPLIVGAALLYDYITK